MYKCEVLKNRSLFVIIGCDAFRLLQKLITNDASNTYCYSYMLNNQGRYICDFFLINLSKIDVSFYKDIVQITDNNTSEGFLVDIDKNLAKAFTERLDLYKLRSDITITDISLEYSVMYSKQSLQDIGSYSVKEQCFSYYDPRYKNLGYRTIISNKKIEKFLTILQLSNDLYIQDKYKFVIPDGVSDLIAEKSIPVEYGGNELQAIDYNKGCYIGQEVIARSKYQGVIRKKIFKVLSVNKRLALEDKCAIITKDSNTKLGEICSAYNNYGIALIRTDLLNSLGAESTVTAAGLEIKVITPEWYIDYSK